MARRRRLAGVDVRHDANIAITLERMAAGHDRGSLAMWGAACDGSPEYRCENYQCQIIGFRRWPRLTSDNG